MGRTLCPREDSLSGSRAQSTLEKTREAPMSENYRKFQIQKATEDEKKGFLEDIAGQWTDYKEGTKFKITADGTVTHPNATTSIKIEVYDKVKTAGSKRTHFQVKMTSGASVSYALLGGVYRGNLEMSEAKNTSQLGWVGNPMSWLTNQLKETSEADKQAFLKQLAEGTWVTTQGDKLVVSSDGKVTIGEGDKKKTEQLALFKKQRYHSGHSCGK